jgi:hypothetical protein
MNHGTRFSAFGGVVLIASILGCSGDTSDVIDTGGDASTQDVFRSDVATSDIRLDQRTPDGPLHDVVSEARDAAPDTHVVPDAMPDATDAHAVDGAEASAPDASDGANPPADAQPDADANVETDGAGDGSADAKSDSNSDSGADASDGGDLDGSEQADALQEAEAAPEAGPSLCSIVQDGLVAAWSLDGTLKSRITGANPLATGAGSSALGFAAGVGGGQGLQLDGNSFAETPNAASLNITDALTMSAWVTASSFDGRIIDKIIAGVGDGYLLDGYGGYLRAIVGSRLVLSTTPAPTGVTPVHVAAVFTGGATPQIRLFVNGVRTDTQDVASGAIPTNTLTLRIGADSNGNNKWNGLIDEPAIWSRALSDQEIAILFAEQLAGTCGAASGGCVACASAKACSASGDCLSGVCQTTCQAAGCSDAVQNGLEVATDCGGGCGARLLARIAVCIDGSDWLHMQGTTGWFTHGSYDAAGQHSDCAAWNMRYVVGVNGTNGALDWPNGWGSPSSTFTLPIAVPSVDGALSINPLSARGSVTVTQNPVSGNSYEGILLIDDDSPGGAAVYDFEVLETCN